MSVEDQSKTAEVIKLKNGKNTLFYALLSCRCRNGPVPNARKLTNF
jgi:hypothetical protein